jgi:hypothetical protein
VNNLIILKELQVIYGTLRKGDKGSRISFLFSKGFFYIEEGRMG